MPSSVRATPIHLLTSFANLNGGCERRSLELYSFLRQHANVQLWGDALPKEAFSRYPVRVVHPYRGEYPCSGTLVILGPHTRIGQWLKFSDLQRVIVVANLYPYHSLLKMLEFLDDCGIPSPEIVYASSLLKEEFGLPGTVEPSPIDLELFSPMAGQAVRPFTVGRLSRDQLYKHHHEDPMLYEMLAEQGCSVRIMGGTCLLDRFMRSGPIELLPEGTINAPDFLRRLDCFFYRTAEEYCEPSGRVVFEAMACGLPVVCGRGGYAEHIVQGQNGFLVHSQEEAYETVMRLKQDQALRDAIGTAARKTVEKLYDANYWQQMLKFYLG